MNVNARYIQELLNMQLMRKFDITASSVPSRSESSAAGESADFNDLLQQLQQLSLVSVDDGADTSTVTEAATGVPGLLARQTAPAAAMTFAQAQASAYDALIDRASVRFGVDPSLIRAVVHAESGFNSHAVSSAGAKGLMQLMDRTARGLGVSDSFDPEQNVSGGTKYLGALLDKYNGNTGVALAAYNAGPGTVDRAGITNDAELNDKGYLLPKETQRYVRKVLELQHLYRS